MNQEGSPIALTGHQTCLALGTPQASRTVGEKILLFELCGLWHFFTEAQMD